MRVKSLGFALLGSLCSFFTSGCGSEITSSGTTATATPSTSISGTVSTGAPLRNADVIVRSLHNNAKITEVKTDETGAYTANLGSTPPPYIIKASGFDNNKRIENFSIATTSGTANVNQLSSLTLMLATKTKPADLFASIESNSPLTSVMKSRIETQIAEAKTTLNRVLEEFYTSYGMDKNTDPITTKITKFNEGLDKILDSISVSFQANTTAADIQDPLNPTNKLTSISATTPLTKIGTTHDAGSMISKEKLGAITRAMENILPIKTALSNLLTTLSSASVTPADLSTYFSDLSGIYSGFDGNALITKMIAGKKPSGLSEGITIVTTKPGLSNNTAYQVRFRTRLADGGLSASTVLGSHDTLLIQKMSDGTWKFIPNQEKATIEATIHYIAKISTGTSASETSMGILVKAKNQNTTTGIHQLSVTFPQITGYTNIFQGSKSTLSTTEELFEFTMNSAYPSQHHILRTTTSDFLTLLLGLTYADATTESRTLILPKRGAWVAYPSAAYYPSVSLSGHSTSYLNGTSLTFTYGLPLAFKPSLMKATLYSSTSTIATTDLSLNASTGKLSFEKLDSFTNGYTLRITAFNENLTEAYSQDWYFDPNAFDSSVISGKTWYLAKTLSNSTDNTKVKLQFNDDGSVIYTLENFAVTKNYNWEVNQNKICFNYDAFGTTNKACEEILKKDANTMQTQGNLGVFGNKNWYTSETERNNSKTSWLTPDLAMNIQDSMFSGKKVELSDRAGGQAGTTYELKTDHSYTDNGHSGTWDIVNNRLRIKSVVHSTEQIGNYILLEAVSGMSGSYKVYYFNDISLYEGISYLKISDLSSQ